MEKERLQLIKSEVETQIEQIDKIYDRIELRKEKKDIVYLESLAYQLHNLYCAFENMFEIVADYFENNIDEKKRYHRELLWRMTVPIEGVRPALLSEDSYKLLDSLRSFRHFFRHAYIYELDPKKVALILDDTLKLKFLYLNDIKRFLKQLGA